ncbi:MAG: hypothetical protein LBU73_05915 [Helicobacteraceae bacterium]|jgi:cell division protein FtsB|nr:hypothetical protein [Helicobacteraceae bacterium]
MANNDYDIRDELLGEVGARPILRASHFGVAAAIAAFAFYIYYLFYGGASLLTLMSIREEKATLDSRVEALKAENAALRRELFELRLIGGENFGKRSGGSVEKRAEPKQKDAE